MWTCKHCNRLFNLSTGSEKANHSRWCNQNPKRDEYKNGSLKAVEAMKRAKKENGVAKNQYDKAKKEGRVLESPLKGRPGKSTPHTEKTKQLLKEKALASKHRRLKKGTITYNGVLLDSSWELALAKRLDALGVKWVRPEPIPWVDKEGITHNYFPDFFLEEYNLYLDPKNPQAIKVQQKKLNCLLTQYTNIVILDTLDKCKDYVI